MRYISTRARDLTTRSFCDILLEGLAPDGGLYLPEHYPQVTTAQLSRWREVLQRDGYAELAFQICQLFIDDIPAEDLRGICQRAYTVEKFIDPRIVPVSQLSDGIWLAHLSNGPSAAFKDMAMQLLGELFSYELARRNERITILGATSGDTGSAAEYALRGQPRIRVVMLSPADRMTPFQQAQMYCLDDPNIVNLAVEGVFDDCQDLVKEINADAEFKHQHRIGAVNSINWARLMAQIVYYFAAWLQISQGEKLAFAVPTGNFGNIAAGHIARQMGLPISSLILATNENNVLDEFFRTGIYRVRSGAETLATSSPSMDISKASNFERFVADLLDRDGAAVAELFGHRLPTEGRIDLSGEDFSRFGFCSGSSSHATRLGEIDLTYTADGVIIDPHTADGVHVARKLLASGEVSGPVVVLETALPVKFNDTIIEAVGLAAHRPERFKGIEDLPRHVIRVPARIDAIRSIIDS